MRQPVDAEARRRAVEDSGTSFAISAGAGSGKTSVLVARLVQHLLDGVPPDRIAAITFTEKAAGELSARARDALEERLAVAPPDSEARRLAAAALDRFGELTLSTIHSFCQGLLQQEPLEAGWAPDTAVIGALPDASLESLYEAWRAGFDRRHPDDAAALRSLANETSPYPGVASIRGAADALLENRDLTPLVADPGQGTVDWEAEHRALSELVDTIRAAGSRCSAPTRCKLSLKCAPLLDALTALLGRDDLTPGAVARAALTVPIVKPGRGGRKADWPGSSKDDFIAAVGEFSAWVERVKGRIGAALHRLLITDLMEHYVGAVLAARAESARADFSDLLFRARALLIERPEARARLSRRCQVLLVDEVQDTDPIQAEVAALLTRPAGAEGDWLSAPPEPGSLLAVGDPRQSIYRFRRADVATWGELEGLIARDGERLVLEQNFRSVPGIVDWVNHTFDDTPQVAWREPAAVDPVVVVRCDDPGEEIEAAAAYLRQILVDAPIQIVDPDSGALRAARPGDVMVLLPAWSHADTIQARLRQAGIPASVQGDTRLFERDEGRLLLEAMRAIEEPTDAAAVLCVLRGLFGFSYEDLAKHRAGEGRWDYTWRRQPVGPVAGALDVLRGLHARRDQRSWVKLLDELLAVTGADAAWAMTGRRWQVLANLDKLRALLRQLEAEARPSGEVLAAMERLARAGQQELSVIDEEADAVRVTSYFKAKGLEAPIVLLVCASRRATSPSSVVLREQGALAVQAGGGIAPPGWDDYLAAEKEQLAEERRRWIYVAVTRARDQLVLVKTPKSSLYATLERGLSGHGPPVSMIGAETLPPAPLDRQTFPGLDPIIDAMSSDGGGVDAVGLQRASDDARAVKAAKAASIRWSALCRPSRLAAADGWVGALRAQAVHRAMRQLDLGGAVTEEEAEGVLERACDEAGLEEAERAWSRAALAALLRDPRVQAAAQAPRVFQAVSVQGEDYGTTLTGEVDLCYATDDGLKRWVVVDWQAHLQQGSPSFYARLPRRLQRVMSQLLSEAVGAEHVEVHLLKPPVAVGKEEEAVALEELLEVVIEELEPLARWAMGRDDPPELGLEVMVGERVVGQLELGWPAQKLGVAVDQLPGELAAMRADGWQVLHEETHREGWVRDLTAALRSVFGVGEE